MLLNHLVCFSEMIGIIALSGQDVSGDELIAINCKIVIISMKFSGFYYLIQIYIETQLNGVSRI